MKFRAKFQPCTDTVECLLSVNFLTLKATLVLCLHSKSYVVGLIEHQYTRALTPTASILGGTNLNVWCDQKKTDHTKHPTLNGRETEASARFRWQLNEIIWKILIEKKKNHVSVSSEELTDSVTGQFGFERNKRLHQCAHSHLLYHMEHFEPNWRTIKLPGMHLLPRNALTKMSDTQLHQNHVNKCSSFSKSWGWTDILVLNMIFSFCCSFTNTRA